MAVDGLVSTIIPVYNRPTLVVEAIESVLAQTYRPIEIIVVDDGSTDSTAAVVEQMIDAHPEMGLLRQLNSGPGPARQKGIEAAHGEFIQFLDSDDLLSNAKFDIQTAALKADHRADVSYGKTIYTPKNAVQQKPWLRTGMQFEMMFPAMLSSRIWGTSTPLYRASLFEKVGPFSNLSNEEDWEMDCRIAALGTRLAWVDSWISEERDVAEVRASHKGSSDPRKLRDRTEARRLILQHAIHAAIPYNDQYMRLFLDSSFLVARQAALAGLEAESAGLLRQLNSFDRDFTRSTFLLLGQLFGLRSFTRAAEATRSAIRRFQSQRHSP